MYISASPTPESEAYSQVLMAGIHCVPDTVGNTVMKNSRIPMLRELTYCLGEQKDCPSQQPFPREHNRT